jgi:hypothetical protein
MTTSQSIIASGDTQQNFGAAVTVLTNSAGNLTKTFSKVNGKVEKKSAAFLKEGIFNVFIVATLKALDILLSGLKPNQAVTYGRPELDAGNVVVQGAVTPPLDTVFRTRDYFAFDTGPGILMLDYDPPKNAPAVSQYELIAMLHKACPALKGVGMLWRPSSSSGVDGAEIRGQRLYIQVSDASRIPRVGEVLFDKLWLGGFGYYAISKSGQLLERGPIDTAVWRPEGMDFAAAPVLGEGVTRTQYDSMIIDGCIFEVADCEDLSASEATELKKIKDVARKAIQSEILAVKSQYIEEEKSKMPARLKQLGVESDDKAIGAMLERAVNQRVLMGDWPLTTQDGKAVTVGMVMDNSEKYHNTRFADPLEPDHDLRVAVVNLHSGGRPYIYSHAHHGMRYELDRAPSVVGVNNAELPRMVDQTAVVLKISSRIYERAGAMVYVNGDGKIIPAKPQWLAVQIQRLCRFEGWDSRKSELVAVACPAAVIQGLLTDAANLRMNKLTAVRNAPTMDCDGRLIVVPGYDEKTALLLTNDQDGNWPAVPSSPTHMQLKAAFAELWVPFSQFPYASTADMSVALAALLTAAVRSCLRTAPGFGFSATAAGTGKTLLAQCIGALYDGVAPAVSPPCPDEAEWSKSLFSAAMGGAGTMLFDNAEHAIESASLCAVTTAPSIKSRVLGESREAEAEHRMLVLATGNGLQFVGDLNRRFFICRLDAKMEASTVAAREFQLEPLSYCLKHRLKLIAAALTLIQGYALAGFPRVCDGLASMDDWNKLVRSAIVWLVHQGVLDGFVDPKAALIRDGQNDPDAAQLMGVLEIVKSAFGTGSRFTVADLVKRSGKAQGASRDILLDIAGDRGDISTRKLGQFFQKREGRIMNGMRIKRGPLDRQKTATWEVTMS